MHPHHTTFSHTNRDRQVSHQRQLRAQAACPEQALGPFTQHVILPQVCCGMAFARAGCLHPQLCTELPTDHVCSKYCPSR